MGIPKRPYSFFDPSRPIDAILVPLFESDRPCCCGARLGDHPNRDLTCYYYHAVNPKHHQHDASPVTPHHPEGAPWPVGATS